MKQALFRHFGGFVLLALLGCGDDGSSDPPTLAAAPSGLVATAATTARIDLTWTDNSDNEAAFLIERAPAPAGPYAQVGSVPWDVTAFSDRGLQANTQYFYRVQSYTDAGGSAYAGPASATTLALNWGTSIVGGGPNGRSGHTGIYQPNPSRMVLFGGFDSGFALSDQVWILDLSLPTVPGTSWSLMTPTGTPGPRAHHSAIYDSLNNRMIIFGGIDNVGFLNDVWILTLGGTPTWSLAQTLGPPPVARWHHTAVYDPVGQQMILYGGTDSGGSELDDVRVLSLPSIPPFVWSTPVVGLGPIKRSNHSGIYDPVRQAMIAFGGMDNEVVPDGTTRNNETWTLTLGSPTAWKLLGFPGTPSMRFAHAALYDSMNERMIMFSGDNTFFSPPFNNELWSLNLSSTPQWTLLTPSGTPPDGRAEHTIIYDSLFRRMILYGGDVNFVPSNELWVMPL